MKRWFSSVLAAAAVVLVAGTASADTGGVLGVLTCKKTGAGMTYVVYSSYPVECTFEGVGGQTKFTGTSGTVGVDLEWVMEGGMAYMVTGASWAQKNLTGTYLGAKASATPGVGLSVQAGLGGFGNNVSLVPIGLGAQVGAGVTAGVGYLTLK